MQSSWQIGLIILAALSLSLSANADELRPPAVFNAVCTSCHSPGAIGNTALAAPQIAGQEGWYIKRQLSNFLEGRRGLDPNHKPGRQMALISTVIDTPKKLEDLADYLSRLQPETKEQTVSGNSEHGQSLYATCAVCHGVDATGNEQLGSPSLRYLDDWYLLSQLQQFQNGARGTANGDLYGAQMRAAVQVLVKENELRDVVAYIASIGD